MLLRRRPGKFKRRDDAQRMDWSENAARENSVAIEPIGPDETFTTNDRAEWVTISFPVSRRHWLSHWDHSLDNAGSTMFSSNNASPPFCGSRVHRANRAFAPGGRYRFASTLRFGPCRRIFRVALRVCHGHQLRRDECRRWLAGGRCNATVR